MCTCARVRPLSLDIGVTALGGGGNHGLSLFLELAIQYIGVHTRTRAQSNQQNEPFWLVERVAVREEYGDRNGPTSPKQPRAHARES